MTITARIDSDFKSLDFYFQRLLKFHAELVKQEQRFPRVAYDVDAEESQAQHFYASHLIKPDMIIGIYGCFEFWIQKKCVVNKLNRNLELRYKDIRGKHDLDAYHKYLTLVAGLELEAIQSSYRRIDELRKVRNILVHNGGHVPEGKENEFEQIDNLSVTGSLLVISDEFIWDTFGHAKRYVTYAANPT